MTPELFEQLAREGYNRIPVSREVLADLDTPLSTYLKLANAPFSYLLESVQGGEKWGRYSIIGLPCRTILRVQGYDVSITTDGEVVERCRVDNPLTFIEKFQQRYKVPDVAGLPRFHGGLVGYFGYDTVRYIEPRLAKTAPPDPIGTPEILLLASASPAVVEDSSGKLHVNAPVDPSQTTANQQTRQRYSNGVRTLRQAGSVRPFLPRHESKGH